MNPEEETKEDNGNIVRYFEELVTVVSGAGVSRLAPKYTWFSYLIGPMLIILRYAWGIRAATPVQ